MNVEGTVISVLPVESGQGKNGVWTKNPYIIETGGQYPKKIAIAIWGETLPKLKEGEKVDCQIDIESREYNNRWYTEVKCYKVDIISRTANTGKGEQSDPMKDAADAARPQILPADHFNPTNGADDLPF